MQQKKPSWTEIEGEDRCWWWSWSSICLTQVVMTDTVKICSEGGHDDITYCCRIVCSNWCLRNVSIKWHWISKWLQPLLRLAVLTHSCSLSNWTRLKKLTEINFLDMRLMPRHFTTWIEKLIVRVLIQESIDINEMPANISTRTDMDNIHWVRHD